MKEERKGGEKKESIEERQREREREDERGKEKEKRQKSQEKKKKADKKSGGNSRESKETKGRWAEGPTGGDEAPLSGQNSIASEETIRIDWVE